MFAAPTHLPHTMVGDARGVHQQDGNEPHQADRLQTRRDAAEAVDPPARHTSPGTGVTSVALCYL